MGERLRRLYSWPVLVSVFLVLWRFLRPLSDMIATIANAIAIAPSVKEAGKFIGKILENPATGNVLTIVGFLAIAIIMVRPESNRSKQIRAFVSTQRDTIGTYITTNAKDRLFPYRITGTKVIEITGTTAMVQKAITLPTGYQSVVFSVRAELQLEPEQLTALTATGEPVFISQAPPRTLECHIIMQGAVRRQDQQYVELRPTQVNEIKT